MAEPADEKPSRTLAPLAVVGLLLLLGVALYFWLAPRTPVVAVPSSTESPS